MNISININQAKNAFQTVGNIAQSLYDLITFKSLREILNMRFDFQLDEEDLRAIDEQLWP